MIFQSAESQPMSRTFFFLVCTAKDAIGLRGGVVIQTIRYLSTSNEQYLTLPKLTDARGISAPKPDRLLGRRQTTLPIPLQGRLQ